MPSKESQQCDSRCKGQVARKDAISALDSDGFTLTTGVQFGLGIRVGYLALGGPGITNAKAGNISAGNNAGLKSYTGVGFKPDTLFLFDATGTMPNIGGNLGAGFGMVDNLINQGAVFYEARTGQATTVAKGYGVGGDAIGTVSWVEGDFSDRRCSVTSYDSNGFSINWNQLWGTGATLIPYLALKGIQSKLVELDTRTDTTTAITAAAGFRPEAAVIMSANMAESTPGTATALQGLSFGLWSENDRFSIGYTNFDNLADSQTAHAVEYDEVYIKISSSDTIDGLMDYAGRSMSGLDFIMDDADPGANWLGALVFGNTPY